MDPRKQKRLGPAPIASFEKSFEDNSSPNIGTGLQQGVPQYEGNTEMNGDEMEPLGNAAQKTTNGSKEDSEQQQNQQQQQQQQPSISVTQTSTAVGTTRTTPDGSTKTRPPPLKATTKATTTLVSSGEQQVTFRAATTLTTPATPRIELSRASSSSYHEEDSRDSSPENVFEQVGTGTLQEAIGLGFREEGALELRSSTEELYFMDAEQKREEQEKLQQQQLQQQHQQQQQMQMQHQQPQQQQQQSQQQLPKRSSPLMFKFDEHQSYLQQHQRKDSASSEVAALLCISGRTSRISSVGSQGSAVSRLSAVSGVSRSPSPHRMLLETSFCGPKPLENNLVDGRSGNAVAPATAEILEQVLLARKHDPTQVVLAEGIRVESSPKRTKPTTLSNGDQKVVTKITTQNRPIAGASAKSTMGRQRQSTKSPGQMVIGKTPSGTEYIRINLKPDHMYNDKGIAPHERVVEAPNSLAPVLSKSSTQKKPISLSLGRNAMDETRLTPTASPKPSRHGTLTKDTGASRSPSPGNVSRKSSFNSLFRVGGKDSPDSPRERSRSRSKSKERQTPQSLNATPSKQKSVLAIFKPNKRGSNAGADGKSSKSSSPIDGHDHHPQRSKSNTPLESATGSRPASRLRYYDEPVEGVIHIPLHTPPEEKETRKLLQGIAQLTAEPMRPVSAPVTASQLVAAAAALKPVRKGSGTAITGPRPQQIEKLQRIENLDAIHTLPSLTDDNKECSWSLEVQRHSSSQDSQETVGSDASNASAIRANARTTLANILKQSIQENGMAAAAEIHRLPSVDSAKGVVVIESRTMETVTCIKTEQKRAAAEEAIAKEKRRLLFATRLGSGSEEQIFSTQFSISKTESQSSQLSEQVQVQSPGMEHLQRMDTVIRRPEEPVEKVDEIVSNKKVLKRLSSSEAGIGRTKSVSTSEDEKTPQQTTVAAIVLRHKDSQEELRRKPSHISTSEDDNDIAGAGASTSMTNQRHSRYLENFDVRRKYHENVPRKPKRQSISDAGKAETVQLEEYVETTAPVTTKEQRQPKLPQPPPPSTDPSPSPPPTAATSQSVASSRTPTPTQIVRQRSHSQSPTEKSQSRQTPTKPPRTTTPTRSAETASPQASVKASPQPDRQSVHSTDEPIESSESERDSELAASTTVITVVDPKRRHLPRHVGTIEDHESTGLVSQESFDDELPYIPTTLPEERAQGVAIIPMKERANMELKTCPVDRPRSTTPLNPSHLEEYCGIIAATPPEPTLITSGTPPVRGEKLRISLPRKDAVKEKPQATKSPRRASNASGKTWFEFAEEGLRATGGNLERKDSNKQLLQQKSVVEVATTSRSAVASSVVTTTAKTTAKATTATSTSTTRKLSGHWIDFENIPEKRKPAKRITALPKDSGSHGTSSLPNGTRNHSSMSASAMAGPHHGHHHVHQSSVPPDVTSVDYHTPHYNYVKPEDCQCECHEARRDLTAATSGAAATETESKPLTNVDLLQQGEDMLPLLDPDIQDGIEPSDSSRELSCYTDDEADAPTRQGSLSRYRAGSNKNNEFPRRDGSRSPRNRKFPDHRYS